MPMWEIMKVKSKSTGSNSEYSAWNTWRDEMIKKTVIKRHFKLLISLNPHEVLTQAMAIENENNPLIDDFNSDKSKYSISTSFDFVEEVEAEDIKQEIPVQQQKPVQEKAPVQEQKPVEKENPVTPKIQTIKEEQTSVKKDDFEWELPIQEDLKEDFEDDNADLEDDDDISFDFPDNDEDDEEIPSQLF